MGVTREVTREENTHIEHVRIYRDRVVVVLSKQTVSSFGTHGGTVYHEVEINEDFQRDIQAVKERIARYLLTEMQEDDSEEKRDAIWRWPKGVDDEGR